ncbi:hypothetical protein ILYODFUR_036847 [Ilyodon furcidens]|uniref:Uncharacterized protein n=1 Tax=Ilyodon furcidens TaxID=33524 RepID=A0ABV0UZH6_9TELE
MEGEFDREVVDVSVRGAAARLWVDLETQLINLQALVLQTRGKQEGEKIRKKIDTKVRHTMKAEGFNFTDKCDLGDWLRKKLNTAKKNTLEAQTKLNEATAWSKAKYRTNLNKIDKEERFWADILLIYQGGIHTMQQKTQRGTQEGGVSICSGDVYRHTSPL